MLHTSKIYLYLLSIFYVLVGIGGIVFSLAEKIKGEFGVFLVPLFPFIGMSFLATFVGIVPQRFIDYPGMVGLVAVIIGVVVYYSARRFLTSRQSQYLYMLYGIVSLMTLIGIDNILFEEVGAGRIFLFPFFLICTWGAVYVLQRRVLKEENLIV